MQEKKTAVAARAAVAPARAPEKFILINIPFCGVEEFSGCAEHDADNFVEECLTPSAKAKIEECTASLDVWTDETRNSIARLWAKDYFRELENLTGIKVWARTSGATWWCDGNWGIERIEVYVNAEDLQKVFDENRAEVAAAMSRALEPSSGFAPFDSAIEESERFDVTEMRPALIESALRGILDAYSSDDTDGLIGEYGAYPWNIDTELTGVFFEALSRSALEELGPYARWCDVEAAVETGEIAVERIPECWIPYLVNCDPSGLPEEEITECDVWAESVKDRGFDVTRLDPLDIDRDVDGTVRVMVPRWN